MKSWPLAPMSWASAARAAKTGADGCPPIVLLQSSKSSACEAAPLTRAASRAGTRRLSPNRRLGPAPAASARERGAHGIQDAHLRPVHGLWGQVGEALRGDAVREFQCECHGSSLVQGSSGRSCCCGKGIVVCSCMASPLLLRTEGALDHHQDTPPWPSATTFDHNSTREGGGAMPVKRAYGMDQDFYP